MSKEIYISSTPHETRLAIVESDALTEIYYERENEYTLAGSIYNGRVTRVLPGMQSSFVDIGLERDAFLYITDFMEEAGETADFEGHAGSHGEAQPRQLPDGSRAEGRPEGRSEGRSDGRREGNRDRGGRGDRGGNREPRSAESRSEPRSEPTDADLFRQAMAGVEPSRPENANRESGNQESGRQESGNRRGGRDRDRRPRNDRGTSANGSGEAEPAAEPHILTSPVPVEAEDLGEGAPGADGSRRWRGRRGRRGNRGERPAGHLPSASGTDGNSSTDDFAAGPAQNANGQDDSQSYTRQTRAASGPVYDAYPQPEESRLDIDASAEPSGVSEVASPGERNDRGPRTDRGGRRGRGGERGRNRGGRDNQPVAPAAVPERAAAAQPPRIPRGFAPSASLYKVEGADETHVHQDAEPYGFEAPAPAEPMILPGESLSKYRPGGAGQAETRESAAAAPPVSAFVAAGWDGGAVLPGETLRPRGPVAEGRSESRGPREERGRGDSRGGRDRNDRGGRSDRGGRNEPGGRDRRETGSSSSFAGAAPASETPQRTSPAAPQADAVEPTEPTYLSDPEHVAASHLVTPMRSTFVAPPPMPERMPEPAPEPLALHAAAEPAEYEPTEASASFRVDPVPPSEFRQAAPVLEAEPESHLQPEAAAEPFYEMVPMPESEVAFLVTDPARAPVPLPSVDEMVAAHEGTLDHAAFAEPAAVANEPAGEPVVAAAVESDPADLHSVSPALQHAFGHAGEAHTAEAHADGAHAEAPEFTSISDTGEMHSEALTPVPTDLPAAEQAEPASPIAHEAAVVHPSPDADQGAWFAPGSGMLEEELLDDDGDEPAGAHTLHALDAHHDGTVQGAQETGEHETLEGAADLASMLHDMSIDHITRSEPAVGEDDDEDDYEEDFLEEDQDFDTETSSADDEGLYESEDHQDGEAEPVRLDEPEHSAYGSGFEGNHARGEARPADASAAPPTERRPEGRSREGAGGRREGRRDGRREGRRDSRDRTDRGFSSPGADRIVSDRPQGDRQRRDSRGGRNSMQATNLPAISDLLKPGQEILVQIAKEPIARKGARITSHIALPGRFLVFMPTVHHTGVSRKIESDQERRRLKEILLSERGEASGGFIVRTAAAGATEEELRSDLRFLLNLWADIKTRSESSKSPALIYHDLNLVERVLRDQVTDNFSAIWVDTESQYEQVLRFLQRFQPSLIRRVKLYTKETPLFEQFGITEEINKALRSKVWLKSGGSIVINQTEALVAIDINTGKFVGKTTRLEDTIVKTNLDAIPEIVQADSPARPRRHHHHRLYRHGRTQEPQQGSCRA